MHTLRTHSKSTKIHIKTLKILPLHVSVPFLRPLSGGLYSTLSSYQVEICWSVRNHYITDCNDIWSHTTQFYNERISTDPKLVTWQSTVQGPLKMVLKIGPKHVAASS